MNSKKYYYASVLAREASFSKAAESLGISQPSLSQYIKKIEDDVGMELFERAGGMVRLTNAGRVFVDAGYKILETERQMNHSLSDLALNKTGPLVIGTAPYRAASLLPQTARAFQARHPGMHLVVREGTTDELIEGLLRDEFDLALTLLQGETKDIAWELAFEEELILAVPASFDLLQACHVPGRKYPAVEPAVLSGKRMVMLTEGQYMQKMLQSMAKTFDLSFSPAVVVKSLEAQIEMVRAGVGMALVPSGIERFCRPSEVAFYSFTCALERRKVAVIWRKSRVLSRAEEELKDVIIALCR